MRLNLQHTGRRRIEISRRGEARVFKHDLALRPVEMQVLLLETNGLPLVENADAGAQHGPATRCRGGERNARRQVLMVSEIRLEFVAQPKQQIDLGPEADLDRKSVV